MNRRSMVPISRRWDQRNSRCCRNYRTMLSILDKLVYMKIGITLFNKHVYNVHMKLKLIPLDILYNNGY